MTKYQKMTAFVGMTIFLAAILLLTGVFWLGQYRLKPSGIKLYTRFQNISGLTTGNPVTVSGVLVGKIHEINFTGRDVAVSFYVNQGVHFPADSRAVLIAGGVFGERGIDIEPGAGTEYAASGDTLIASVQPSMDDLAGTVFGLTEAMEGVLSPENREHFARSIAHLDSLMQRIHTLSAGDLGEITQELLSLTSNAEDIISDNRRQIKITISELADAACNLNDLSDSLSLSSEDIRKTMSHMERASTSLDSILGKINSGEGTLGKLVNDDLLYLKAAITLARLDSLIIDFKAAPKKYLSFKLF